MKPQNRCTKFQKQQQNVQRSYVPTGSAGRERRIGIIAEKYRNGAQKNQTEFRKPARDTVWLKVIPQAIQKGKPFAHHYTSHLAAGPAL